MFDPERNTFLVYFRDMYSEAGECKLYSWDGRRGIQECDLNSLAKLPTAITYSFGDLIPLLRARDVKAPKQLIDVCHVARILTGRPHRSPARTAPWAFDSLLQGLVPDSEARKRLSEAQLRGIGNLTPVHMLKIAGELLGHIEALWRVQVSELRNRDEYERYFKVEKPLNEMLIECQLRGLRVDLHRLEKRIDTLDDSLFLAKRELKTKWNVDDTDDLDHIRSRISELFLPEDIDFSSRESLDSSLKLLGDTHPFLRCLKTFRDSRRDREILLRLGAFPAGRAFPTFECMGTVTGRVTLKDPPIQNLKRTSRDVFLPEEGFQFVYPDYSQFEPGIMADDSGDSQLISDYNAGDLYSSLSVALFGSVRERAAAKILFLSFCYGMSHSRMASFAARLSGESLEDCQRAIAEFFGRYTQLDEWQGSIEARLLTEGRVGSHMGNYRYRDSSGKQLSPIERRWAATQRIQGTASLILKKVMIRIFRECESIKMLIPMHDAVLCEVPQEVYDDCAKQLERLFIEEFHAECPSVEPRVTFNAFS